ncbi:Vi polysaccharide biosynthesis UDP-N-acetylglucosamine C-6 dehydrogenase TviB [Candidatus Pelagibacter sp.]|nr:Vi polysaccharide biosynthesis UDP-N-acetylglucosamine C-6 dehydrogenase TviB [Candidatus Pelagibacter sp.]
MKNKKIAIIGLGYVGLPLAVEFGKKFEVIGFDINKNRIDLLKKNEDQNLEISKKEFLDSIHLNFSNIVDDIKDCNIYIVTVPTPIDNHKKPNLSALKKSSEIIGSVLKKNDIVIYESTVYPGATEEFCAPILEKKSGLKFNIDFYCGYSPERINPGDKKHKLIDIKKITSGSTAEIALVIDDLYKEIIIAGTYKAESIQVAEAAKVIENTQRDLNIALINELAIIFKKMNIDTEAILKAAETKWNFMPFRPGLVGGHCIGVDPYYLTHKANAIGYKPEVILAGRKLNDNMASYVANEVSKLMKKKNIRISKSNILIMGITFKENCPDYRNTQVVDLVKEFKKYSCNVEVHDPWVSHKFIEDEYNISLIDQPIKEKYDAIILAVAHDKFKLLSENLIRSYGKSNHILYDIKYLLKSNQSDGRL